MQWKSTRRQFLGRSLGTSLGALVWSGTGRQQAAGGAFAAAEKADQKIAFFLVSDTHYLADKTQPQNLDSVSAETNRRLIDVLNALPGTEIPPAAGGGTVLNPRGVIHSGDLIDSGDKQGGIYPQMHATEWAGFTADFGLTGQEGRLRYPVFEVHGNHDGPAGQGLVLSEIVRRNQRRPGCQVSENGHHYSWDWGPLHVVCLGIVVGEVPEVKRKRRYNPLESLQFLVDDLQSRVGTSGRPVVLVHHVDLARYSTPPKPDGPATSVEWDPADVQAYYQALSNYNIAAILYGHTHARNIYRWNGTPQKGAEGHPVYNVAKSGHFSSPTQALMYFELHEQQLLVRELITTDRWQSWQWTAQNWSSPARQTTA